MARTGYSADPLSGNWGEGRVTLALFLCGAMAGLAYWLVAGRSAAGEPDQGGREMLPGAGKPSAP